jgi:hypothetical protein
VPPPFLVSSRQGCTMFSIQSSPSRRRPFTSSHVAYYSHCERRCQRGLSAQNAVLWLIQADEYALDGLREITLGYAIDSGIGLSITVD